MEATWWPEPRGLNRVIVPVVATTVEEAERRAKVVAKTAADLVEWRADGLAVPLSAATLAIIADDLREIVAPKPLLFTWRTCEEGGRAPEAADAHYAEIVTAVLKAKTADLVDVQIRHPAAPQLLGVAKELGVPVVGSWHDMQATPTVGEIADALAQAESLGASVAKVAVTPHDGDDLDTLANASTRAFDTARIPLIVVGMGEVGMVSRVYGHLFGSQATFASVGEPSAPGQLDLAALQTIWQIPLPD